MTAIVTITDHNKSEWRRMAKDAYARGLTNVGHLYSAAASCPSNSGIRLEQFDKLQAAYRQWLINGFAHTRS